MTINEIIKKVLEEEHGDQTPTRDISQLFMRIAEELGENNDGLLFSYLKEAHQALEDIIRMINREKLGDTDEHPAISVSPQLLGNVIIDEDPIGDLDDHPW